MSDALLMSQFRTSLGENSVKSTTQEYFEWKILRNPYQQGKIYLEYKDKKIVGSTTITPKNISIGGKEILAAEIGDTYTHPEYRRQGIFSRGVNACTTSALSRGIKLIYGTPNTQSLPGYQNKLGYPPCPFIKLNYLKKSRRIPPVTLKGIAKFDLRGNGELVKGFLSAQLRRMFLGSKYGRRQNSYDILTVDRFEDEIDGLWGHPRYIFCTVRDKTYLNWRYHSNPDNYRILAAKEGGDYWGYLVAKLSKDGKRGFICDYITRDDRMDVFHTLVQRAEKMLIDEAGVDLIGIQCVFGSPYYQALIDHAYYDLGPASQQPVIVFSRSDYGKLLLETDARWHFTLSDTDNI